MLGLAASEGVECLLMYLFVPLYSLYFLISRWSETRKPFMLSIIACIPVLPLIPILIILGLFIPTISPPPRPSSQNTAQRLETSKHRHIRGKNNSKAGPIRIRLVGNNAKPGWSDESDRSNSASGHKPIDWNVRPDPRSLSSGTSLSSKPIPVGTFGHVRGFGFAPLAAARMAVMHSMLDTENRRVNDRTQNHLCWLTLHDLTNGSVLDRVDVPNQSKLLAVNHNGTLAVLSNENQDCEIFVWSLEDNRELLRWKPNEFDSSSGKHGKAHQLKAIFIENNQLLTVCGERSTITLWHLPEHEVVFSKTAQNIKSVFVSPGRRYVIYTESNSRGYGDVHFIDVRTGDEVGNLSCKGFCLNSNTWSKNNGSNPVSSDGCRLALQSVCPGEDMAEVYLWDLSTGKMAARIAIDKKLDSLQWLGSRFLIARASAFQQSDAILIDTDRNAIVWRFKIGGEASFASPIDGPDDRCWFQVISPLKQMTYLMPLDLVTDAIKSKIDTAMPNGAEPLIASGRKARIVVGEFNTKGLDPKMPDHIRAHLGKLLKKVNMSVDDGASLKIMVTCKNEPVESAKFQITRSRFGMPMMHGCDESSPMITVPAMKSKWRLALFDDTDRVVWERNGSANSSDCVGYLTVPEDKNKVDYVYKKCLEGFKRRAKLFFFKNILPVGLHRQPVDDEGKPGLGRDEINLMSRFKTPDDIDLTDLIDDESPFEDGGDSQLSANSSRKYLQKVLVGVVAESDDVLQDRFSWFPAGKRPAILLRWGFGIQITGNRTMPRKVNTARDVERVIGEIGVYLGKSLEDRIAGDDFGAFPKDGPTQFSRVTIMGIGKQETLIKAARRQAVDVVLMADVTQKSIGLGGAQRITMRFRLIDARKGDVLWTSRPLSNSRSAKKLMARELADMIFEEIDANYTLQKMPPLTAAAAEERIKKLVGLIPKWKSEKRKELLLSFIIEARYYHSMGWISATDAIDAYARAVGAKKAKLIADGDAKQRRKVLRSWLKEK